MHAFERSCLTHLTLSVVSTWDKIVTNVVISSSPMLVVFMLKEWRVVVSMRMSFIKRKKRRKSEKNILIIYWPVWSHQPLKTSYLISQTKWMQHQQSRHLLLKWKEKMFHYHEVIKHISIATKQPKKYQPLILLGFPYTVKGVANPSKCQLFVNRLLIAKIRPSFHPKSINCVMTETSWNLFTHVIPLSMHLHHPSYLLTDIPCLKNTCIEIRY